MVGRLSRIRVSSVTRTLPPRTSVGTLKSTRTSTRFPRTSRSRRVSFIEVLEYWSNGVASERISLPHHSRTPLLRLVSQHFHQLHAPVAVAPLIIIPAHHFYEAIAAHQGQLAVEDAGVRIANDVLRNEGLIAEFEHAFVTFIRRRFLECRIDRVCGRIFFQHGGEIGHRTIRRRHPER